MKQIKDYLSDIPRTKDYQNRSYHKKSDNIIDFYELINNWEIIVGEKISQGSIPLKLKMKSLTILTSHAVYAQQLGFMQSQVIKKIETNFPVYKGKIKRLFFQTHNVFFQEKVKNKQEKKRTKKENEQKWHRYNPEYKLKREKAEIALQHISDPKIKEKLILLYLQLN